MYILHEDTQSGKLKEAETRLNDILNMFTNMYTQYLVKKIRK